MTVTAYELETIINKHLSSLNKIQENDFSYKPLPTKWSKKEIMGHLIDSAQNNLRRFIVAQYEENPVILYNQDKWVSISHYQEAESKDIIQLWYLLNKQICAVLKNSSEEMLQRMSKTNELHSIDWLAKDYVKHLLHHLHVVLDLEPVAYP